MSKVKALFYLFFPLFLGGIVGFLIKDGIDYTALVKPPYSPPSILFPIVWSIIYLLMGISYFIYKRKYEENSFFDFIYYLQLAINVLWSIIFFVWKARFFSILWILLLDSFVFLMIYILLKKKKVSAYLNSLYFIWCLFATYLTIGIYLLN